MYNRSEFYFFHVILWVFFLTVPGINMLSAQSTSVQKKFYISSSGSDGNPGTITQPWQTLEPLNHLQLYPGDAVYLRGGNQFKGSFKLDMLDTGTATAPIIISSYDNGKAVIDGGNETAIQVNKSRHVIIKNLVIKGDGRKNGNEGRGMLVSNASNIEINQVDVSGFQKSGVEILNCSDIQLKHIYAHDNGFAGISVQGDQFPKFTNHRIYIGYCRAENNPGDPTIFNNHSGNGIVIGLVTHALIEFCTATNNGWDMPRKGNGPVGIWAWESDSIIIQQCISFRNRTAPGAMDGGGFDLDGGVTNSIVQYNLSYENEGYGYGIFQFSGATPWHHNTFRYNISFNDGNTTSHGASVLWWNGSKDSNQFHDCFFYNNVLYNSKGYVLGVIPEEYANSHFLFLNNIFVAKDEMMTGGKIMNEQFYGNAWWSSQSGFKLNGNTDFAKWANSSGNEKLNENIIGTNVNPEFINPVSPTLNNPLLLQKLFYFQLPANSTLRNKGVNLKKLFHLDIGGKDFFGNSIPRGESCEPGVFEME